MEILAGTVERELSVASAVIERADIGAILVGFRDFADEPAGVAGLELDDGGAHVFAKELGIVL